MEGLSKAEERAFVATQYIPFAIQLHEVRRSVKQILDLFGRNSFFAEYTVHDFSHVEAMLEDLEWIIPESTKEVMTAADWLLITLAIYFHDLGLIVTEEEFQNRDVANFDEFCNGVLFKHNDGKDYRQKVEALGKERAERFFYQEFVRFNHAKRVRAWIEGRAATELGYARAQAVELDRLLSGLDSEFRRDLANVCESHNLDDLDDLQKYRPFRPYGRTPPETANVLYAAVILRTVDLLQITRQRAPSVMFRMINPTDPISQIEWTKQNAVRGISKTSIGQDRSRNVGRAVKYDRRLCQIRQRERVLWSHIVSQLRCKAARIFVWRCSESKRCYGQQASLSLARNRRLGGRSSWLHSQSIRVPYRSGQNTRSSYGAHVIQ